MKAGTALFFFSCLLLANLRFVAGLVQFTPKQSDWSTFYSKPAALPKVTDHSPDGVGWLKPSAWVEWDGVVIDPSQYTRKALANKICPANGNTVLGLREVFYANNPFADVNNPTKAEVDEWHRISIEHIRNLFGITTSIEKDHCLFARALWGDERKFTRKWDSKYPDNTCVGSTNGHCGASFIPSPEDQAEYLPEGHPPCRRTAGSEGVSPAAKSDIPWSIKWVRVFCNILKSEGFNGGHMGW